jgi:hypothetical protein
MLHNARTHTALQKAITKYPHNLKADFLPEHLVALMWLKVELVKTRKLYLIAQGL